MAEGIPPEDFQSHYERLTYELASHVAQQQETLRQLKRDFLLQHREVLTVEEEENQPQWESKVEAMTALYMQELEERLKNYIDRRIEEKLASPHSRNTTSETELKEEKEEEEHEDGTHTPLRPPAVCTLSPISRPNQECDRSLPSPPHNVDTHSHTDTLQDASVSSSRTPSHLSGSASTLTPVRPTRRGSSARPSKEIQTATPHPYSYSGGGGLSLTEEVSSLTSAERELSVEVPEDRLRVRVERDAYIEKTIKLGDSAMDFLLHTFTTDEY